MRLLCLLTADVRRLPPLLWERRLKSTPSCNFWYYYRSTDGWTYWRIAIQRNPACLLQLVTIDSVLICLNSSGSLWCANTIHSEVSLTTLFSSISSKYFHCASSSNILSYWMETLWGPMSSSVISKKWQFFALGGLSIHVVCVGILSSLYSSSFKAYLVGSPCLGGYRLPATGPLQGLELVILAIWPYLPMQV